MIFNMITLKLIMIISAKIKIITVTIIKIIIIMKQ